MTSVNASKHNRNGALSKEIVFLGHRVSNYTAYVGCSWIAVFYIEAGHIGLFGGTGGRVLLSHFLSLVSRDHNFICTLISEPVDRFLRYVVFNVMQLEVTFNAVCYSQ